MTLRTLIFWPHLIAGVLAGTVVLLMSATGVLLTYERQVVAWSDRHIRSAPPGEGARPLTVEALLGTVRRDHPDLEISGLTLASDPDAPATLTSGRRTVYADAYSGRLLGTASQGVRAFMSDVRAWHRWLAVEGEGRPVARAITGWSNTIFLFIVASGFYLWFPRKWTWQRLRPVVLFGRGLTGKPRDFNWHNVLGMWSAVPLFIVVLTAMPISFPWANAFVYRAVGEDPPQQGRGGREGAGGRGGRPALAASRGEGVERRHDAAPSLARLDALWSVAEQQVAGWKTINVRIPESADAPVVFAIDKSAGGQPQHRSTLTLDRATGAVVSFETFSGQSLGRRLRSISRFAHTGEVLGLPGQTIAGLVSGVAVVLVWTGIALTLRRFTAWTGRRRKRQADTDESRREPAA